MRSAPSCSRPQRARSAFVRPVQGAPVAEPGLSARGFTLVEVMIAVAISALVILAAHRVFTGVADGAKAVAASPLWLRAWASPTTLCAAGSSRPSSTSAPAQIARSRGSDAGWHHAVPRISEFYGIVIELYRDDHPPAHFHAQYGGHWVKIAISDGDVIEGSLPREL